LKLEGVIIPIKFGLERLAQTLETVGTTLTAAILVGLFLNTGGPEVKEST
jgi:hypothetical protein